MEELELKVSTYVCNKKDDGSQVWVIDNTKRLPINMPVNEFSIEGEIEVNQDAINKLTEKNSAKDARIAELEGFIGRFLYDAPGISDKVEKILAKGGK